VVKTSKAPRQSNVEKLDDLVFKAMANGDRRRIMDFLRERPRTTGEICQHVTWLNRCTVMQHLRTLERAELVIAKKRGRYRFNYLDIAPIQRIHRRWIKEYAQPAAEWLCELKEQLENHKIES
jgi:DNA-binding transcriptional ArsR family regulator